MTTATDRSALVERIAEKHWPQWASRIPAPEWLKAAITEALSSSATFTCAVQRVGKTDPPQDCDWPFCGCDEHASKVIAALQECGWGPR